MTKQSTNKLQENVPHCVEPSQSSIDKNDVANYLLAHPRFLTDNPDLLTRIQIHIQDSGVVSLTQIQAKQSREKIKQLKSQLDTFVENARKNEFIYSTYAQLNLDLAKADSRQQIEKYILQHLVGTLGLETASLVLLDSDKNEATHSFSEIQHRSIFDKKLAKQAFYFGRVGKVEKEALFPNAKARSVALIRLCDENKPLQATGLLAIASADEMHFHPTMDTSLVDFLRKHLNFHLSRLA